MPSRQIRNTDATPSPRFADNTRISPRLGLVCPGSRQRCPLESQGTTRSSLPNHNRHFPSQSNYLEHQRKQAAEMKALFPKTAHCDSVNILFRNSGHEEDTSSLPRPSPALPPNTQCLQESPSGSRETKNSLLSPPWKAKVKHMLLSRSSGSWRAATPA